MRYFLFAIPVLFGVLVTPALACRLPPDILLTPAKPMLNALESDPKPFLQAMDTFAADLEACYDAPLEPLELAQIRNGAVKVRAGIDAVRAAAEARVRGNEIDFEGLLSSDLWQDLESLRVAGAYAQAWGSLAQAARQVSAEMRHQALEDAIGEMRALTLEFSQPVIVQRSMYGLATAQIEIGNVPTAVATLDQLKASLSRGGHVPLKTAVDAFYAEITAPDYTPPVVVTSAAAASGSQNSGSQISADNVAGGRLFEGKVHPKIISAAEQALNAGRSAAEISALLAPAFAGEPAMITAALNVLARDKTLMAAADYQPARALHIMDKTFTLGQFASARERWRDIKPYYTLLPPTLRRRVDYQLGVSLVNLNAPRRALPFLRAAHAGYDGRAQKNQVDKFIVLARLSSDGDPDADLLTLARRHETLPEITPKQPLTLDQVIALRARVVLARDAASRGQWRTADELLSGFLPDMPAYKMMTGMRVRLIARGVRHGEESGEPAAKRRKTARGGQVLYSLWRQAKCPPGCVPGDAVAVHRAAIDLAVKGPLDAAFFGEAYGAFQSAGGDVSRLTPVALSYLVGQRDAAGLLSLLEPADESGAAAVLGVWKKFLQDEVLGKASTNIPDTNIPDIETYGFLRDGLSGLQGRPAAVLREVLVQFNLAQNAPDEALRIADLLAQDFPRRPSAWYLRAEALRANARDVEAARALSSLARRTPADDPVGMGARVGLAAIFTDLDKKPTACAMVDKIFARPQAAQNWAKAVEVFPLLVQWEREARGCKSG